MKNLSDIRNWSHKKRIARLKEVVKWLSRPDLHVKHKQTEAVLDEGVVIMLEVISSAKLGMPSFEIYEDLLDTKSGQAWDLMGLRMLETKQLVESYKAMSKSERLKHRSKLVARGMI